MDKLTIVLTQSQKRDAAMREQGICPVRLAIKPGVRVEQSKKRLAQAGHGKHKKKPNIDD